MTTAELVARLEAERMRPTPPRPYAPPEVPHIDPDEAAAEHRAALAAAAIERYEAKAKTRRIVRRQRLARRTP